MKMAYAQRRNSSRLTTMRAAAPVVVETMEPRTLMSVSMSSGSTITDLTGYAVYAQACMGDNGDPWGVMGLSSGTAAEETGYAPIEWDSNLSNGLDSGLIDFTFTVNTAAGTMSWAVGGADPITYDGNVGSGVGQVAIQAAVTSGGMAFAFSNVSLSFYNNNSLVDTEDVTSGPAANTIGQGSSPAEQLAIVTPDASSDKVVITGSLRLQAAQGTYPLPSDIFGQIFIRPA